MPRSVPGGDRFGVFDPTSDPTKEETYAFLDAFLGEMAALFLDPYLHIGGDENNGKQWDANPAIQAFMKKQGMADNHALQAHFNPAVACHPEEARQAHDRLGRSARANCLTTSPSRAGGARMGLPKAAQEGRDAILSNGWYIDLCQSAEYHYRTTRYLRTACLARKSEACAGRGRPPCGPNWWTPERGHPHLATDRRHRRAPRSPGAEVTDVTDMYRRMELVSAQLTASGATRRAHNWNCPRLTAGSEAARTCFPGAGAGPGGRLPAPRASPSIPRGHR